LFSGKGLVNLSRRIALEIDQWKTIQGVYVFTVGVQHDGSKQEARIPTQESLGVMSLFRGPGGMSDDRDKELDAHWENLARC
jgi:hypothetical protein